MILNSGLLFGATLYILYLVPYLLTVLCALFIASVWYLSTLQMLFWFLSKLKWTEVKTKIITLQRAYVIKIIRKATWKLTLTIRPEDVVATMTVCIFTFVFINDVTSVFVSTCKGDAVSEIVPARGLLRRVVELHKSVTFTWHTSHTAFNFLPVSLHL